MLYLCDNNINILLFILIFITDSETDTASEDECDDSTLPTEIFDSPEVSPVQMSTPVIDSQNNQLETALSTIKLLEKRVATQESTITMLRASNSRLRSRSFRLNNKFRPLSPVQPISQIQKSNLKDFLLCQLEPDKKLRGKRYKCDEKMFALSLWHSSPKCYRLLRTTFSLPSICTLRRSIKMIDMRPGFHERIFESIREKVETFTKKESLVAIAFDEMSIKTHLQYDEGIDSVIGYEDYGNNQRSEKLANYATVFGTQHFWIMETVYWLFPYIRPYELYHYYPKTERMHRKGDYVWVNTKGGNL